MYSTNMRWFLACLNGAQFTMRLAQNLSTGYKNLRIATRSLQRPKNAKNDSKKSSYSGTLFSPVKVAPRTDLEKIGEELTGKLEQSDLLRIINEFWRSKTIKGLAAESGLDEHIYRQGVFSFRQYCLQSKTLPPDLHIIMSDIKNKAGNITDIFPLFLRFVKQVFPHLDCIEELKKIGDISEPAAWYPEARALKRKIIFHCGPTNSGKTYQAMQRFLSSESGIYCAPLKLLASEVYRKTIKLGISCDLHTGDEIILSQPDGNHSGHVSCTVEMCPLDKTFDVAVIDEIQMLRDSQRGWAWTRALLGVQAKEIHVCGEEGAVNIVDSILCTTNEEMVVKKYDRLTKLTVDNPVESFKNIEDGDCVVCFNKADIFKVARTLESLGREVAVIYGSLPPNTKLAQCEKFNDPTHPCKVLVATDAVGMGLNLNIRRLIFYSLTKIQAKESGETEKKLISVSQALQIAGRAGRFGTIYEEGYVTTFEETEFRTLKKLLNQQPDPVKSAGLLPTCDQIELFSYYLPKSSLYDLIVIFSSLCKIDNSLYFVCDLKELKYLSQMIDHVPLPLRTKFIFCCAPVDRRLHFVCVMFIKFARMYSLNQAVTVSWICENIKWPLSEPKNLRELVELEIYYEVLELYLWLGNRFEEYFPDGEVIRQIQNKIDDLIRSRVTNLTKLGFESENSVPKEEEEEREEKKITDEINS